MNIRNNLVKQVACAVGLLEVQIYEDAILKTEGVQRKYFDSDENGIIIYNPYTIRI